MRFVRCSCVLVAILSAGCLEGGFAQRGDEAMARGDWGDAMTLYEHAGNNAKRDEAAGRWLEGQLPRARAAMDAGKLEEAFDIAMGLVKEAERMKLDEPRRAALEVLDAIVVKRMPAVSGDQPADFPRPIAEAETLTKVLPAGSQARRMLGELDGRAMAAHRRALTAASGHPGAEYFHARMIRRYGGALENDGVEKVAIPAWALHASTSCEIVSSVASSAFAPGRGAPVAVELSGSCSPDTSRWETSETRDYTETVESFETVPKNVCEQKSEYVNTTCHTEHYSKDLVKEVCTDNRVDHEVCHTEYVSQKVTKQVPRTETVTVHHVKYSLRVHGTVRMSGDGVSIEKELSVSPSIEDSAWSGHSGGHDFTKGNMGTLESDARTSLANALDEARHAYGVALAKTLIARGESAEQGGNAVEAEGQYALATALSSDLAPPAEHWFTTRYTLRPDETKSVLALGGKVEIADAVIGHPIELPKPSADVEGEQDVIKRISWSREGDGVMFLDGTAASNTSPGGATRGDFRAGVRLDMGKGLEDDDTIGGAFHLYAAAGADTAANVGFDVHATGGFEVRVWQLGFSPLLLAGMDVLGGRDDGGFWVPWGVNLGLAGEIAFWPYARWDAHLTYQHPWRYLQVDIPDFVDQEDRFELRFDYRNATAGNVSSHLAAGGRFVDYDGRGRSIGAFIGNVWF